MVAVRHGLILAMTFFASLLSNAVQAYTPEQQQACSGDAFRLCGPEIPDVDRVTGCMIRNRAQLSPGCRVYFRSPQPVVVPMTAARRPVRITPAAVRKPAGAKPKKTKKSARPASAT